MEDDVIVAVALGEGEEFVACLKRRVLAQCIWQEGKTWRLRLGCKQLAYLGSLVVVVFDDYGAFGEGREIQFGIRGSVNHGGIQDGIGSQCADDLSLHPH